jgi:hypothetical protein
MSGQSKHFKHKFVKDLTEQGGVFYFDFILNISKLLTRPDQKLKLCVLLKLARGWCVKNTVVLTSAEP